jgi:hypothetical protein
MRNFFGLGMVLCSCVACTTPVASQPAPADPLNDTTTPSSVSPTCRMVNGTADIDGATQNVSGLACKQPDGTWQIQQQDTGVDMGDVYPPPPYPYYPYYDPWFYGPPVAFGFGASFVFVDRFHHFHHMDHVHFGPRAGFRGGFHREAVFTEGAASMEEALFTEAGRTVSAWLHTRGSPPYARAGWRRLDKGGRVAAAGFRSEVRARARRMDGDHRRGACGVVLAH